MEGRLPISFSWVVVNEIAGMSLPLRQEMEYIKANTNVGLVVSTTEGPLSYRVDGIEFLHVPISDGGVPSFIQVKDFIKQCLDMIAQNKSILVHCHKGLGRTGLMLASYIGKQIHSEHANGLALTRNIGARKSIQFVRKKRPGSIQNEAQETFVSDFVTHMEENKN